MQRLVAGLWLGVAAACGSVDGKKQDAAVSDTSSIDAPGDDGGIDTMLDASNCMMDSFDGAALGGHWTVTAGSAPTYAVAAGKLSITDAPFANTPSNATESWINNVDTDFGNQIGWSQTIGTGDYVVRSHLDWLSSDPELMISGIAVTDATHKILAFAGAYDGAQSALGGPYSIIAGTGTTLGTLTDPGSIDLRIERTAGTIKVFVNGVEVSTGPDQSAVTHVSIVAVPYRQNSNMYGYGTADYTFVEVCK